MKHKALIPLGIVTLLPFVASADITDIPSLVGSLRGIINSIIPLLFGVALLAFMWGVIHYIWEHDPTKIKDARNYMVFSVLGIAVMLSVWGLALFVKNSFFPNATPTFNPTTGTVPTGSSDGNSMSNYFNGTGNYQNNNDYNGVVGKACEQNFSDGVYKNTGQACTENGVSGHCNEFGGCIPDSTSFPWSLTARQKDGDFYRNYSEEFATYDECIAARTQLLQDQQNFSNVTPCKQ